MNYRRIRSERQFKDSTGHSKSNFLILLKDYEATYLSENGQSYEKYIEENVTEEPKIKKLGDALFFVLFQLKNDLIFGSLGVIFEMSEATAHENFKKFSILLELTLKKKGNA